MWLRQQPDTPAVAAESPGLWFHEPRDCPRERGEQASGALRMVPMMSKDEVFGEPKICIFLKNLPWVVPISIRFYLNAIF